MCKTASIFALLVVASLIKSSLSQICRYTCTELEGATLHQDEVNKTDDFLHCVYMVDDEPHAICDYDATTGAGIELESTCPWRASPGPNCPAVPRELLIPPHLSKYTDSELMEIFTPQKTPTFDPTKLYPRGSTATATSPQSTSTCSVVTCPGISASSGVTASGGGGSASAGANAGVVICTYTISVQLRPLPALNFVLLCPYVTAGLGLGANGNSGTAAGYFGLCPGQASCSSYGRRELYNNKKRASLPAPGAAPKWKSREQMMYAMTGTKSGQ